MSDQAMDQVTKTILEQPLPVQIGFLVGNLNILQGQVAEIRGELDAFRKILLAIGKKVGLTQADILALRSPAVAEDLHH